MATAASESAAQSFTLDGRLYSDTTGTAALQDPNVQLVIQILTPAQDCILYEETQNVNTSGSNGYFNIQVGAGTTAPANTKRSSGDSGLSMNTVFSNVGPTLTGKSVANSSTPCTYIPQTGDLRYTRILMTPSIDNVTRALAPNMELASVPSAITSERAENLQGYLPTNFLVLGTNAAPALTQTNFETVFSPTNFPRLISLLSVAPSNYVTTGTNGTAGIPQLGSDPASVALTKGQMWFNTGSNALKYFDGTAVQTLGTGGSGNFSTSNLSVTSPLSSTVTSGTVQISLPLADTTHDGYLSQADWNLFNGKIATNTNFGGDISGVYSGITVNKIKGIAVSTGTGTLFAGEVLRYDGTSSLSMASLSPQDLRSSVTGTQAFPTTCVANQVLTYNSVSDVYGCATLSASDLTTGTLAVANGGTGTNNGSITGTSDLTFTAGAGNRNIALVSTGTGNILLNSGSGKVGIGTTNPGAALEIAGQIKITGGTPGAGKVLTSDAAGLATWTTPDNMNNNTLKGNISGSAAAPTDIPLASLQGTTSTTFAAGNDTRITGALQTSGGTMSGMLTLATGTTTLSPLRIPSGTLVTTPASGNVESDGASLYWTNSSAARRKIASFPSATPTNGQLLIGNGTDFTLGALTQGAGITITNSAGGISISATGSGGTVTSVTSANADIAVANNNSTPALTLNSGTAGGAGDAGKIAKLDASGLVATNMIPSLDTGKLGSGTLPTSRGGTGASSFTNFSVVGVNGSGNQVSIPGTTTNTLLQWTAAGPTWSAATYPDTTTANQILYSTANNVVGGLATANNSILTTNGSGVPSWNAISSDAFTQYALLAGRSGGQVISGGTGASENLTLDSTAHATKGNILLAPTGGNVGIGTTNPTALLHIAGTNSASGSTLPDVLTVTGASNTNASAAGAGIHLNAGGNSVILSSGASLSLGGGSNNSSGGKVSLSAGFYSAYGATLTLNTGTFVTGGGTGGSVVISGGTGNYGTGGGDGGSITLNGGDNAAGGGIPGKVFLATNSGLVGIGTTAPATKLDVGGSIRVGNGGETCGASYTGALRYLSGNLEFCNGSSWNPLAANGSSYMSVTGGTVSGNMTINPGSGTGLTVTGGESISGGSTISGGATVTGGASVSGGFNNNSGGFTNAGAVSGVTTLTASTAITDPLLYGSSVSGGTLILDSTSDGTKGNILLAPSGGNVGIGTTSPTRTLEVSAPSNGGYPLRLYRTSNTVGQGVVMEFALQNSSNAEVPYADVQGFIQNNAAGAEDGSMIFRTSKSGAITEQMRINSSGNVGIGTTSPAGKLDVVSNALTRSVTLASTASNGAQSIFNASNNGGSDPILLQNIDNTAGISHFIGLKTQMSYTSGALTPVDSGSLRFYKEQEWTSTASTQDSGLYFATTLDGVENPKMTITSDGNVGIGTSVPRGPFHVMSTTVNKFPLFQSQWGTGGTVFGSSDTIPISSSLGFIGYNGLAIIPNKWGNGGTTADYHNAIYLAGGQTTSASSVATSINFANWAYFTGTGTVAAGLGNATAQGDAVSFSINHRDLGSQFNQRLDFTTRNATGSNINAMSLLSSGNVGIGNTAPTSALHITEKTDGWESSLRIDRSWDSTTDYMQMMYDYEGLKIRTSNDADTDGSHIIFKPKDVERMRITDTGNVGIGTTNPSYKLDIAGSLNATSIYLNGTAFSPSSNTNFSSGIGIGSSAAAYDIDFGGNTVRTIGMDRNSAGNTAGNNLTMNAGGATTGATDKNGGTLSLSGGTATGTGSSTIEFKTASPQGSTNTTDNAPTTKMTILGNGNVGIGTTSPSYKLDLRSDANSSQGMRLYNADAGAAAATRIALGGSNDPLDAYIQLNGMGNTSHGGSRSLNILAHVGDIAFLSNNGTPTPLMTIKNAGNVGIGTTSPQALLNIIGTDSFTDPHFIIGPTSGNYLEFGNTSGGNMGWIGAKGINTNLILRSQSNVGVTSSSAATYPGAKLSVNGGVAVGSSYYTTSVTDGNMIVSGNVGIGTTSPGVGAKVETIGNIAITGGNFGFYLGDTMGNQGVLGYANSAGAWNSDAAAGDIILRTASAKKLFLQNGAASSSGIVISGGNVGIGTTAPQDALHILTNTGANLSSLNTGVHAGVTTIAAQDYSYISLVGKAPSGGAFIDFHDAQNDGDADFRLKDTGPSLFLYSSVNTGTLGSSPMVTFAGSGNVGIGTSSPTQKFEVVGAASGGQVVTRIANTSGTANTQAVLSFDTTNNGFNIRDSQIRATNNGANQTDLEFYTADAAIPAERMRIDNTGNVGIGTTAPRGKLEIVNGSANTNSDPAGVLTIVDSNKAFYSQSNLSIQTNDAVAADTGGSIGFGGRYTGTDFANYATIKGGKETANAGQFGGYMTFATRTDGNSPAERMRINPSGYVGIGTTNPTYSLDISSSSGTTGAIRMSNTSGNAYLYLNRPSGKYGEVVFSTSNSTRWDIIADATAESGSNAGSNFQIRSYTDAGAPLANPAFFIQRSSGNVGIGLTNPGYLLDVNGHVNIASASALKFGGTSVCTSAGCTTTSDERLKENIELLDKSLEKVLQLRGVEYDYINKAKFGEGHQIGVIAQEVEKIYPEVVRTDSETGLKAVAYDHLVAPLIEAIKTLYKRLRGVENQLDNQKRQIASKADKTETEALKIEIAGKDKEISALKTKTEKAEKENEQIRKENAEIKARLERIEKMLLTK